MDNTDSGDLEKWLGATAGRGAASDSPKRSFPTKGNEDNEGLWLREN